jgi:GNAT superfamily N-acetyltransferase
MKLNFRKAISTDIPFLIESVIFAEKIDNQTISFCTLFGIDEGIFGHQIYVAMSEKEGILPWDIDHWYVAANNENKPIAALSAWEEPDSFGSEIQKFQYLNFCNKPNLQSSDFLFNVHLLTQLAIPREPSFIQLDSLYTKEIYRGKGIMSGLIEFIFASNPKRTFQIQALGCNQGAIKLYKAKGFIQHTYKHYEGLKERNLLADNTKINFLRYDES